MLNTIKVEPGKTGETFKLPTEEYEDRLHGSSFSPSGHTKIVMRLDFYI